MTGLKTFAGLAAVAMAAAAVPAQAVVFATYAPITPVASAYSDIRWINNGTNGANGTSGQLVSSTANGFAPAGDRLVSFSFLSPILAPYVTNLTAKFNLLGTAPANSPAVWNGLTPGTLTQSPISGGFSFTALTPLSAIGTGSHTNLLTATFGGAVLEGPRGGFNASFAGDSSVSGQTVTFTSDFLDFSTVSSSDFEFILSNVRSFLAANPQFVNPTKALRTFRAAGAGEFGTNEAPLVIGVPEPQTWGLMVVGFGLVGLQVRRRANYAATAA